MTRREATLAGALALGLVLLNVAVIAGALGAPPHRPRAVKELDHRRYIAMAQAPPGRAAEAGARERPFCYRILAPALVRALAGGSDAGLHVAFWATSMAFLAGFLFALLLWLRTLGMSLGTAAVGTILAGLTPGAVRWYAYQYWMPDPLCLFLVTLGLLCVGRGRYVALALVAIAGVLTRETFVLVPVWAGVRWMRELGPRRGLLRFGVTFAPALAAWLGLRTAIVPEGGPTLAAAASEMLAFRARHLFDNQLYFATLGSLGVLVPLLVLRGPRRLAAAARARPEDAALALTAFASLAFANNTDRLLAYALPVLLPPALRSAIALGPRRGLLAAIAVQAWFYGVTPGWGIPGLSLYQPVSFSVVGVCGLVLLWGALRLRRANAYSS